VKTIINNTRDQSQLKP